MNAYNKTKKLKHTKKKYNSIRRSVTYKLMTCKVYYTSRYRDVKEL